MLSLLHFNLRICFRTKIPRQSRTPTVIKNGFSVYEKRDGLHAMDKHRARHDGKIIVILFFRWNAKLKPSPKTFFVQQRIIWLTCTIVDRKVKYVTLQNQFYITSRKFFYGFISAYLLTCIESQIDVTLTSSRNKKVAMFDNFSLLV